MRSVFAVTLIAALLFAGGYFYYVAQAICPAPLGYSIGVLDDSFGLSHDEARLAISDAESVWEDATGQNLFMYDEDAGFKINFVYDERQEYTDAEGNFKEKLDKTQTVSDAIGERYSELVAAYNDLQIVYSDKVELYEKKLSAYNSQVAAFNEGNSTDKELYEALQERKVELDAEQISLNNLSQELNDLVKEINEIGNRGNILVETYNRGVQEYNNTFGDSREFTQGTYSSNGQIDIYTYANSDELRLVLAHELGHALSLDHVANEESVMYFLIGEQPEEFTPTIEDINEYIRVCSKKSFWDTIQGAILDR